MTLLQLRYFREVAHTKHFTAAAENLHVAQPSLSYSIKELEKEHWRTPLHAWRK